MKNQKTMVEFTYTDGDKTCVLNKKSTWTSIHGVEQRFCDMTNEHLVNLLKYLGERSKRIPSLQKYDNMISIIILDILNRKRDRVKWLKLVCKNEYLPYEFNGKKYTWDWSIGAKEIT